MPHRIEDRAIVAVSGADAHTFLQGLITNDVDAVAPGAPIYAALLTPQGKILFDFLIADDGTGALLLDCWAPARDALIKRLSMYRLRAKVEIGVRDDLAAFASWDGSSLPGLVFTDPRLPALGKRSIAPSEDGSAAYLSHRLSLGVPEGRDFGSDKIFALDAGLGELHGVAFDKGCYVGQELTARMNTVARRASASLSLKARTNPRSLWVRSFAQPATASARSCQFMTAAGSHWCASIVWKKRAQRPLMPRASWCV